MLFVFQLSTLGRVAPRRRLVAGKDGRLSCASDSAVAFDAGTDRALRRVVIGSGARTVCWRFPPPRRMQRA